MSPRIALRAGALIAVTALALTGCAAGGGSDSADAACAPAAAGEKVNLTFTSWLPGIDEAVAIWNDENPDIQVEVQTGPNGNGGTYKNFFNQIAAGNAPDLGQIEYDALPNFRVQDGLVNIADCAGITDAQSQFVDWTWSQVTFGEDNAVYAIPQDTGPEALYYRADLFEKAGIPVPTTWDEYAAAAAKIREQGGYITNFSQSDINAFAGLVWQAGGQWFENDGTDWSVTMDSPESTKVADYWQGLIEGDLVAKYPPWTDEWNNAYNTGELWTWVSAVWGRQHDLERCTRHGRQLGSSPDAAVERGRERCRKLGRIDHGSAQGQQAPVRGSAVRAVAQHGCRCTHGHEQDREHLPGNR